MSKYKKETVISTIALSLVSLAWGTSYAIIKDALNVISPFMLMSLRFGLATIIMAVLFIGRAKKITKKDLYGGTIIGLFLFVAFFTLVTGIQYTTASKQSFIVGAYVLIVPFLAWVINHKRPDTYSIAGAVLATIGLAMITLNGVSGVNKGDLIAVLCAAAFAGHMIAIERFRGDIDPIISTIVQFGVTALLFIILTGIFESFTVHLTHRVIISGSYLVLISTVLAFAVQNVAQRYISSSSTALILTLESAFGGVFAVFFLGEIMTLRVALGCVVIFLGIIIGETKLNFIRRGSL